MKKVKVYTLLMAVTSLAFTGHASTRFAPHILGISIKEQNTVSSLISIWLESTMVASKPWKLPLNKI